MQIGSHVGNFLTDNLIMLVAKDQIAVDFWFPVIE
jgi:hypothetical protein